MRDNYPLGDGSKLAPYLDGVSPEGWFEILNSFFWVFPEGKQAPGFLDHLRLASPDRLLSKVVLATGRDEVFDRLRLSPINGGQLDGAARRGRATYQPAKAWQRSWGDVREIGILGGIPAIDCSVLRDKRALTLVDEATEGEF